MNASRASEHLRSFADQHNLRDLEQTASELGAITWTRESHVLISDAYVRLPESELERLPAIGVISHLLHRAKAHLEAAIVAFTTGSAASSEALSRATVELSSTIQFILAGQPESRVLAYFEHYIGSERKRLGVWGRLSEEASDTHKGVHAEAIKLRRSGVDAMGSVVGMLEQSFVASGVPLRKEQWPDIASRFESIDDALGYRTYYGRMSGQVHSDAEETIRYFIGRVSQEGGDRSERMALESTLFSRLMLYLAVRSYMRACSAYARYAQMKTAARLIEGGASAIERELVAIVHNLD